MVALPRNAVPQPTRRRSVRSLAVLACFVVLGAPAASAQTVPGIVPASTAFTSKDLRVVLGFPSNTVPSNVTGFRVNLFCTASPATFDGTWTAIVTFGLTGTAATVPTPFTSTTQCVIRLTVLGTGSRPLVLTSNSVDSANVTIRYLDAVDGVAVDPATVIEFGPIVVKDFSTIRFGAAAPVPTTTTASTTTTTTTSTTTTSTTSTTVAPTTRPSTIQPTTTTARRPVRYLRVCVKRVKGRCTVTRLVRR